MQRWRRRTGASGRSLGWSALARLGRPAVALDLDRLTGGDDPVAIALAALPLSAQAATKDPVNSDMLDMADKLLAGHMAGQRAFGVADAILKQLLPPGLNKAG